jgi:hypothetical protein
VLDVLLLLSVPGWLLQSSDDKGGGGGDDGDSGLSVLDGELDGDTETFLFVISIFTLLTFALVNLCLPSLQWPSRYLHRPSWATDQEDRSWAQERTRHPLHLR